MTTEQIQEMQRQIGVEADGFWGPRSQTACRTYLRRMMPKRIPWPSQNQASLRAFYGQPGDESKLVTIDFPYPMTYGGKIVRKGRVNAKCADSLLRVLTDIGDRWSNQKDIMEEATDYYGIFNYRLKRGGTSYSLHAYGAAIDLDADDNSFKAVWPVVADMPLEIMEAFSREGWLSAGAFWGYDAMHFQATQA